VKERKAFRDAIMSMKERKVSFEADVIRPGKRSTLSNLSADLLAGAG
jgi:hypothetical protein